ncbi:MAG: alpha-hydroxy acid oxidase [Rhodospirillales bacterium]|jgi:isopentenyl diphosphate isomerase/L-lactate dehydrogenase-like FMN-dependent dehydrogenase
MTKSPTIGKRKPLHPQAELRGESLPEFMTIHEIIKKAHQRLHQDSWDYLMGGTETETTLRRNRFALDSIGFTPRICRDVSEIDITTTFLNRKLRLPLLLAPIGQLNRFATDGGATAARAAEEFGIAHMVSSQAKPGLEAVAAAADNLRIYQLYVRGDQQWIDDVVKRAIDHGYSSLCLTVDSAHYSRRERDISKGNAGMFNSGSGHNHQSRLSWDQVKHYKDHFDLPLIIKGIATQEDAQMAIDHGVEGIYVSNHGGRQLDHGRGCIDVLPEIVQVAKGKATIIIDSGFCRGSDIVKAKALGADMIGLGKLQGLALAAGDEAACVRMLEILEHEMITCFGLIGCTSFDDLDSSYLTHNTPSVTAPHVTSAFPLLNLDDDAGY